MTVEDLDAKIKALRGNLKNGRTTEADRDIEPDDTSNDSASGATFQTARREIASLTANNRKSQADYQQSRDNRRSTEAKSIGVGQPNRRPGNSDSGLALHTADNAATASRAVGRMEAVGPIPERVKLDPDAPVESFGPGQSQPTSLLDKYPKAIEILSSDPGISGRKLAEALGGISPTTAGNIKKEWDDKHGKASPETSDQASAQTNDQASAQTSGFKLPNIGNVFKSNPEQQSNKSSSTKSKTLNKSEVEEYKETLTSALESDFQALDEYLWHRQMAVGIDTDEQPVWSDLDTEEIEKLTKVMLKWGERNATAAVVVRGVVESSDYIAVASIFVPRVKSTVDIMRKTRRPRQRRGKQDES